MLLFSGGGFVTIFFQLFLLLVLFSGGSRLQHHFVLWLTVVV